MKTGVFFAPRQVRAVRRARSVPGRFAFRRVTLSLTAACVIFAGVAGDASGYLVHARDGRAYGLRLNPASLKARQRLATAAGAHSPTYHGGPVMLSSNLRLIFWGSPKAFSRTFRLAIVQWASDLAADSGKATNEFSVGSLYYENNPRRQITQNVSYGGVVFDSHKFPRSTCVDPAHRHGTCLRSHQFETEIARIVKANHWPTDPPSNPTNQYLILTPKGVAGCDDNTSTSCTFSSDNGWCAEHSAFNVGQRTIVYSILPYTPQCGPDQTPSGVFGNADANGVLDSAIHEVLESATDPLSEGQDAVGWSDDSGGGEVGDLCSPSDQGDLFGDPLGGSLDDHSAYNQTINGHNYMTQEIWAPETDFQYAGCVQRAGPSPDFYVPDATAGSPVSFDGSYSSDATGTITTYVWSFGDGSPTVVTSTPTTRHTYARAGSYRVVLGVLDASGFKNASVATQTEVVR